MKIYNLRNLVPCDVLWAPVCHVLCKACGAAILRFASLGDVIELDSFAGEDLMSCDVGFVCSQRAMKKLLCLPGLDITSVQCRQGTYWDQLHQDGFRPPRRLWQVAVSAEVEGFNPGLVPKQTEPPCSECGRSKWVTSSERIASGRRDWEFWRPKRKQWNGEAAFWMVDQSLDRSGPIVTQAFVDIVEDFNLGPDAEIHEVKWAEE